MDLDAIEISGRRFTALAESTFEHDLFVVERLRRAGLDQIHVDPDLPVEAATRQFVTDAFTAGVVFELLGGVLCPEGRTWSPEVARDTAEFCRTVADPAGKAVLQAAFVSALLGFFAAGLVSFRTSPSSSMPEPGEGASPAEETVAPTTSATGERSSGSSPATTPSATAPSSEGP